jgi:microcystin-dependent protein
MAQPYVGEIKMFAGNFAPQGWLFCDGSLQAISENETLFNLIGTTYGGDGQSTFALPDMRGRLPVHQGNGLILAETGGVESVTLTVPQIPAHQHGLLASRDSGNQGTAAGAALSNSQGALTFLEDAPNLNMHAGSVQLIGGSQPHENLQPYLCISFIISMYGIFPSPT